MRNPIWLPSIGKVRQGAMPMNSCPPGHVWHRNEFGGFTCTPTVLTMPGQQANPALTIQPSSLQGMIAAIASRQPTPVASDCVYFGDACCKMMSNGIYRCSWPDQPGQPGSGGACTPGLEGCPAWLINEIKRNYYTPAPQLTIPVPVPVPSPAALRRAARRLRREIARQTYAFQSGVARLLR